MKCVRFEQGVSITVEMDVDDFGSPMAGVEEGARIVCRHELRSSDHGAFSGAVIKANREGYRQLARYCLALAYHRPDGEEYGYHNHVLSAVEHGLPPDQMELTLALLPKAPDTLE